MSHNRGEWMQTASGIAYYPTDPRPSEVNIEDIAHALSNLCRFGGHCRKFYSVAEHSVLVSRALEMAGEPLVVQQQGLMHDATEAYCVDLPRPLKHAVGAAYSDIEDLSWQAIAAHFGLPYEMFEAVKREDNNVLLAEKIELLGRGPAEWTVPGTAANVSVIGFSPAMAKAIFMSRYQQLFCAFPA